MAAATENLPPTNDGPTVDTKNGQSNGDAVTVFHDPENFNVKHPLMHEWTLWFTKPPTGKVYLYSVLDFYFLAN